MASGMSSLFYRLIVILLGFPLLIIPTLYATIKELNELPWGFNKFYGNAEDGWNGNGEQRRYWNGQGWYPDYLGSISVEPYEVFDFKIEGNTLVHDKSGLIKKWYKASFKTTDNKVKKSNYLYRKLYKDTFIALRWGWKIYPDLMVTKNTMPKNKDRSVYSVKFKIVKN